MERRGLWASLAGTVVVCGAGMVVGGVTAHILWLTVTGAVAAVSGLGVFSSLLWGVPAGSLRAKSPQSPIPPPASPCVTGEEIPVAPFVPPLHRIGDLRPGFWPAPVWPEAPELHLRVAVQMPGPQARRMSGEVASVVRSQAREEWLAQLLESLPFTAWVRNRRREWNWDGPEPCWEVRGAGDVEFTDLVLTPQWTGANQRRLPFTARCSVLTGWQDPPGPTPETAIRTALDLVFNVLELDENRRPGQIRHATTPPPAPAALSLDELAAFLVHLGDVRNIADQASQHLLGRSSGFETGQLGMWVSLTVVELERVIDLRGIRRLPGSPTIPGWGNAADLPLPSSLAGTSDIGNLVGDLLDEMLEHAGYRGIQGRFDPVRHS